MKNTCLTILSALAMCACTQIQPSSTNANMVEKMAKQALQSCGKGNVKSVSNEAFTCKEPANQAPTSNTGK